MSGQVRVRTGNCRARESDVERERERHREPENLSLSLHYGESLKEYRNTPRIRRNSITENSSM
jgi:hypothetical protein